MRLPALYPILDSQISSRSLDFLIAELAAAGARWVQLREKKANSRQFFSEAQRFVELARRFELTAIINDRTDLAWLSGADGVHLGQDDLPVESARKILGAGRIIGCSTHNLKQALEAEKSSADYVAIGPVFATTSKENPDPTVSWDELMEVRRLVTKPLVAIGGISAENAARLFDMGIDSVAVIRDLLMGDDIQAKVATFLRLSKTQK
jgi:thiamine-phosphate pyrophosphorylase